MTKRRAIAPPINAPKRARAPRIVAAVAAAERAVVVAAADIRHGNDGLRGIRELAAWVAGVPVDDVRWNTPRVNRAYGFAYRNGWPMNDAHRFAVAVPDGTTAADGNAVPTTARRDAYAAFVARTDARRAGNALPPVAVPAVDVVAVAVAANTPTTRATRRTTRKTA